MKNLTCVLLFAVVGCGSDVVPDTESSEEGLVGVDAARRCRVRTGGAFIEFDIVGQSFTTWSRNDAFIDTALDFLANGTTQIPMFDKVVAGTDCDPQWSWHVNILNQEFVDGAIEVCDAAPQYIEDNLDAWIISPGEWCPFNTVVTNVRDRR